MPSHADGRLGHIVYMVAIGGVSVGRILTSRCGIIEMTSKPEASPRIDILWTSAHIDLHIPATMKELEQGRPGRFGSNGKLSSGYSLTNFCWTLGMFLELIVTGFMTRTLGYSYMSYSIGRLFNLH